MENIHLEKALEDFDEDLKKAKRNASKKYVKDMMKIHEEFKAAHPRPKMLKEGKERVSTYRVYWRFEDQSGDEYWQALNAQQAVDFTRQYSAPEGAEIIEVAKVVNNWK